MLKDADIDRFRKLLLAESKALKAEDEAAKEARNTVELDQQSVGRLSRMDALQRQAMAQAMSRRRAERDLRITAALKRIDDDEFGFCQDCGEDIELKRLTLDPTSPRCLSCTKG